MAFHKKIILYSNTHVRFTTRFARCTCSFLLFVYFAFFKVRLHFIRRRIYKKSGLYFLRLNVYTPAVLFSAINKSITRKPFQLFEIYVEVHFCAHLPSHWSFLLGVLRPKRTVDVNKVTT